MSPNSLLKVLRPIADTDEPVSISESKSFPHMFIAQNGRLLSLFNVLQKLDIIEYVKIDMIEEILFLTLCVYDLGEDGAVERRPLIRLKDCYMIAHIGILRSHLLQVEACWDPFPSI